MNFKFYLTITSLFIVLSYNAFSQLNADFSTYTPTNGCSPLNVVFKDQSTGAITTRKWIFGNGNSTSSGNQTMPSAIYGIPGAYTVTLIVSDGTNYDTIIKPAFITVYNDPVANFTNSTALSGCNPINIGLLDNSTSIDGAITIWNWDFGDGQTSTDHIPTHTYVDYGTFPVALTVFDEHGCNDTKIIENYVNVSQTPVPDFVASDTSQCFTPFNVSFTNLSTSAGNLTYSWNFGEGTTSTLTNPSNTFNSLGSYDITLFASDENGCSDTLVKNDYITILDATADFNTFKNIYCIDEDVTFDNTSVGCTSYLWNFGDGVTDTAKNPVHSYSTWGDYIVKLISFRENSPCSDTIVKAINVERVDAAFTLDPARYCELPVTVNFTDQSINAVSWEWDMGYDSTASPSNPVRITSSFQNPIKEFNKADYRLDSLPYYFSRAVYLKVTSIHGCENSIRSDSALIVTIPKLNTYPIFRSGCAPIEFYFDDSSSYNSSFDNIISRLWTLYDGSTKTQQNFNLTINDTGVYNCNLNIQTALGCSYDEPIELSLGNKQNPNFIIPETTACASDTVWFFDNSTDTVYIDRYYWKFTGDTSVSYEGRTVFMHFPDTGFYNLKYTIWQNGCDTSIYLDSVVHINGPIGKIKHTFDCANPLDYSFNPEIIDADKWLWDFGDGIKDSTQINPVHTYSSGDYEINLEVFNTITGCSYIDSAYFIRPRDLKAEFITDTIYGCPGLTVTFFADSSKDESYFIYPPFSHNPNLYQKYLWDYDDGSFFYNYGNYEFTDTTVIHTFYNKGIYDTKLIVRDINGCQDTAHKTITIYLPQPDFSTAFESGCKPFNVDFTNLTPPDTTITAWHWDFGNGDTSNIQNPSTTYNEYGSYDVMLSATNILGCTSYITKPGFISVQTASPSFTVLDSTLCSNDSTFFINTTAGENLNYLWNFGDGNTSSDENPIHFYADSGSYNISLKVIDTVGCDTTFVKYNYINKQKNPIANFVADTLNADCYPIIVSFSDSSGSPYISLWNWDFGDNATSSLSSPIHSFSRPGQFDVKLVVTTSYGCFDSIIKTDYIVVKGPYADFSFINPVVCKDSPIAFYIDTLLDVDQFSWDFGDGVVIPGTGDTIYHTYGDYGLLYPQLIYSDSANTCPQFERDSITINLVNAGFVIGDSVLCSGSSLNFINSSFGDIFYDWNFGDGNHSGIENPTYSYSSPGNYTVYLTVSDQYACSDVDSLPVTVHPLPNYLALNDSIKCDYDTIYLDAGIGFTSYLWSDNSTLQTLEVTHQGQYTVKVQNTEGCWSAKDTIKITDIPTPFVDFGNDTLICEGTTITLSAPWSSFHTYNWSNSSTFVAITASPLQTYSVTVSNQCGEAHDTIFVDMIPLPTVNIGVDTAICTGTSIPLVATGSQYDSYFWNNGSTNDSLIADTIRTYSVMVYNSCDTVYDSKTIDLIPIPALTFVDDTLCEGTTITVFAPFSIYHNYLWNTGDTIDSITAFPDSLYSVTVTNVCDTSSASIFIEKIPLPVVNLGVDTAICTGTSLTLFATGSQYDSYLWNDGSTLDSLVADTIYTYSVTVSNTCNSANDSKTIDLIPIPALTFVDDTLCEGTTISVFAPFSIYHNYLWNTGDTIDSITAFPDSLYSVTVTNVCDTSSASIFIEKIPLPVVNIGVDTAICNGTSLTLFATGSQYDSYLWNDGSTLDSLVADTIYTYSVTVSNVCDTANGSKTIDLIPIPALTFVDDTLCEGTTITVFAPFSIYHNYLWNTGDTIDSITAFPDSTYWLNVTSDCGTAADTIFIEKIPLPVVNLGVDTAICTGTSLTLFATGSQYDSYLWNDGSTLDSLVADTINTYSVTVSNVCDTANGSKTIDLIPIPNVTFVDDTLCEGTTITVFAPFSIYHNYLWSTGDTIDSIIAIPDSLYSVTVTNVCDTSSASIFIEKIPLPVINLGVDTAICTGTTLTLFATGSQYDSYLWNDSTTLDSLVADTITTYSVTVSNACNSTNDSISIDLIPIPNLTFIDDTLCEGTTITVFAPFSIYHNYLWNTGDTIDSITAFPDSTYWLNVTSDCGTAADTIFIEKIPLPTVNLGVDTAICNGTSLTIFATGSQYDSYLWNDGSTLDSLIADTIYTYSVTVSNVCDTANGSKTIDLIPIPNLSFVDDTLCEGTTMSVFAPFSIYHNYLWNTGDTIDSITAFPDSTYWLNVTSDCGTSDDTIFIEKIPLPVVNLGVDTAICNGTSLTLFATGSQYDSYLWNDGSTLDSLVADTIYTYSVTVSNVCDTANGSKTIDLIPIPTLTFIDDTLCEGTTITIFAPFSIYHNYLWNTGDTIDSITAIPDSTYWLNVTSDCGSANDTIFIEKIPLPVVNLGVDTAICTGTSLTLFATGSQYDSYLWNDSTKLDTLIADSINTYSVTVTNSCFDVIDSVIIDLIPIPDVFLGNDTLICEGTTLLLKADSSIYNTYIWNNDSASISQQTDTISYFAITVTNICGTSTDSINIGLKPNPIINFGNDTTFCENSNITINWIAGYTDYYWDNILALQSITVSVTDTLSLMVRDSVGCFSNVDTIIVTAVYPATANLGIDTTICIGDSLLLTANAGYDSYSWNNGSTNDSLFISQTGTYILEVKNTCNTAFDTLNLIVYEIQIELGLDTILCPSETITLDAGSGFTSYKWNDESTNQTLTVNSTGTYFVEVSNICIGVSDTVDVFYLPNSVNLGSDTAICEGNIISFSTPDNFDTLTWHNGFNYPVFTTSKPGTYYLTAENKCGTFSDTIILAVKPIPSVELGPDIAVSFETETLDAGDDATTYLWSTGDSTQTIQVTPGNYAVWVEVDKDGCKASDTIRILYSPYDSGCIFGVPNAFTPNGDNKNDVLHVRGYCIEQVEFMVFNRFGEMVFKSEDINTGWDGKYKGRLQESEVYIWYLKVKLTDGQVVEKTGNVALLN